MRGLWAIGALCLAVAIPFVGPLLRSLEPVVAESETPDRLDVAASVVVNTPLRGTVIPSSAVATMDGRPIVFVVNPDLQMLVATPIELGEVKDGAQRVLAGISAGQVVLSDARAPLERLTEKR